MIDNITLRFYGLTPAYHKLILVRKNFGINNGIKGEYIRCRIPNRKGNHSLFITKKPDGEITIKGSLRKWVYGENSLRDLNEIDTLTSLKLLVEKLDVSIDEFLNGEIVQMEIGKTIKVKEKCSVILRQVNKYGNLEIGKMGLYFVKFFSSTYSFKLYEKIKERTDKGQMKPLKGKMERLRFELNLGSVELKRIFGNDNRIRNIIGQQDDFEILLRKSVNKLEFYNDIINPIQFNLKDKKVKDFKTYLIALGAYHYGHRLIKESIKQLSVSHASKTNFRRRIEGINKQFELKGSYTKSDFLKDIDKGFIK